MRVKGGVAAKKKKKKILKAARGYRGALSRRYRLAKQYYIKSGVYSYFGRKQRKRDFRKLWITRINAAARSLGIKYNDLIHGLKEAGININRKMLADLAVNDFNAFKEYVSIARENISKK
ncbi:MAG: 50S ribosomal protein L20 [Kosmotogaceae bacterium]